MAMKKNQRVVMVSFLSGVFFSDEFVLLIELNPVLLVWNSSKFKFNSSFLDS